MTEIENELVIFEIENTNNSEELKLVDLLIEYSEICTDEQHEEYTSKKQLIDQLFKKIGHYRGACVISEYIHCFTDSIIAAHDWDSKVCGLILFFNMLCQYGEEYFICNPESLVACNNTINSYLRELYNEEEEPKVYYHEFLKCKQMLAQFVFCSKL